METGFFVIKTKFHGGGIVSRHISQAAAEKAAKKYTRGTDCACGCCDVVTAAELHNLRHADEVTYPQSLCR